MKKNQTCFKGHPVFYDTFLWECTVVPQNRFNCKFYSQQLLNVDIDNTLVRTGFIFKSWTCTSIHRCRIWVKGESHDAAYSLNTHNVKNFTTIFRIPLKIYVHRSIHAYTTKTGSDVATSRVFWRQLTVNSKCRLVSQIGKIVYMISILLVSYCNLINVHTFLFKQDMFTRENEAMSDALLIVQCYRCDLFLLQMPCLHLLCWQVRCNIMLKEFRLVDY